MATQENMALVQKLYLAYYGRPADPGGQAFWAERLEENNGNLDAIIDAFGNSAEFDSRFGDFSNDELVDNLYQQIFGRPADAEGRAFYVQSLNEGSRSLAEIATSIVNGAQNEDVTILDNRVAVANGITRGVQERDLEYGPAQIEAAGQLVTNVAANTNVNEYIQSAVNQFLEWPADQLVDDYSPDGVSTNGIIATGQSLTGSLEVIGDEDWFAIDLNADTEVTIDLTGNFDTVLEVRDSQGNLVTSNDDGGEGFNSRLTLDVSETDTYFLVASAYAGNSSGDYRLDVSPADTVTEPEPGPTPEPEVFRIVSPLAENITVRANQIGIVFEELVVPDGKTLLIEEGGTVYIPNGVQFSGGLINSGVMSAGLPEDVLQAYYDQLDTSEPSTGGTFLDRREGELDLDGFEEMLNIFDGLSVSGENNIYGNSEKLVNDIPTVGNSESIQVIEIA